MLDNFEQNPLTNVMTFGTSGDCTIEGIYGNTYEFNSAHAYSIESVEGDKVTLTNASRHDNEKYVISKDSFACIRKLLDFWNRKRRFYRSKNGRYSREKTVQNIIQTFSASLQINFWLKKLRQVFSFILFYLWKVIIF